MTGGVKGSNNSVSGVKLFVAGVPTGINQQLVADFFAQFGRIELMDTCGPNSCRGANRLTKGHTFLICQDKALAEKLTTQKCFTFMGRNLSVSYFRSGTELISQNQLLNKCRVIFKKVPSHITERDLREEVVRKYGALDTFFQYKPVNPSDSTKTSLTELPKYNVFSAVFKVAEVAQKLIDSGFLELDDGSKIITEKFTKFKGTWNEKTGCLTPGRPSRNLPDHSRLGGKQNTEFYIPQKNTLKSQAFNYSKPSSALYFRAMARVAKAAYPYNHNYDNLRLNARSARPGGAAARVVPGAFAQTCVYSISPATTLRSPATFSKLL